MAGYNLQPAKECIGDTLAHQDMAAQLKCSRVYDTASDQLKWGPEIVPVRLLSSAVKKAKFGGCHQSVGSCPSNWFAARHSVKM